MVDIGLEVKGAHELVVRYEQAPRLLQTQIVAALRRIGARLHGHILAKKLRGPTGADSLNFRTGNLSRALFWRIEVEGDQQGDGTALVRVGVPLAKAIYARAQAQGATIVPRKGRFLAIPLRAARTEQQQVARFSAREFMANPEAFGYTRGFIRKHVIFGAKPSGVTPLFALKESVRLPARDFLGAGLAEQRADIAKDLGASVRTALRGGTSS